MIKIVLGVLGGLILGVAVAFAYNRYLGAGPALVQAETKLAATGTDLTQATQASTRLQDENTALSAQVKQLFSQNEALQGQVEQLKKAAQPAPNPMTGIVKAQMQQQFKQKLALLKSRLHLTPEQEAAVQAAMDREEKNMEDMTVRMLQGEKPDPQAAKDPNVKSVDQTLDAILTPEQKTAQQQMKSDEKTNQAEMMATFEMNQAAPLLQLSDAQKDQVYSALYQVQLDSTNPENVKKITAANPGNPTAILDAQSKAKEDALASILTPAQMAQFHQQLQSQMATQKAMMEKFTPPAP